MLCKSTSEYSWIIATKSFISHPNTVQIGAETENIFCAFYATFKVHLLGKKFVVWFTLEKLSIFFKSAILVFSFLVIQHRYEISIGSKSLVNNNYFPCFFCPEIEFLSLISKTRKTFRKLFFESMQDIGRAVR